MTKIPTRKEEDLERMKQQMASVERYSEPWFSLQKEYQKLLRKIKKEEQ